MSIPQSEYIWHNGKLVPWAEATTHVLSHALHYGSSVFEGIRVYETHKGSCFFRLRAHTKRLYNSAKLYRMPIPYTPEEINAACHQTISRNDLHSGAYVRPIAFRGYGGLGVAPREDAPVEVSIAAFEWGTYLGAEALENGVDACISSWARVAPNTIPSTAKAGGNYLSNQLIAMEAQRLGFAEGIGLAVDGTVSEGAGENIFVVKDGVLYTPPAVSAILAGITRDTIVALAEGFGIEVREHQIPREMLYFADELFFTGTAAEVTPVRSVDRIEVGDGKRGPITAKLQEAFFGLFSGATPDEHGWLEPVEDSAPAVAVVS